MENSNNPDNLKSVKILKKESLSDSTWRFLPADYWSAKPIIFFLVLFMFQPPVHGDVKNRPSVVIEQDGIKLTIKADLIEASTEETLSASGNVIAEYGDTRMSADRITYNKKEELLTGEGDLLIARGVTWLKGSRAEFNINNNTGVIFDASGFTDEELYINAEKVLKTGDKTYTAVNGFLTSCTGDVPKWQIRIRKADITLDENYKLRGTVFKIKKIPVLYLPYMYIPAGKKQRSSGLLLPSIGNSDSKGTSFEQRLYLTLGRSADLMLEETLFTKRGLRHGMIFRSKPSKGSFFDLSGSYINDKLNAGGWSLTGLGEINFQNGFRAVADFNLVSNFLYRQTFTDNFITATRPTESSVFFLNKNFKGGALNIGITQEETLFSVKNTTVRKLPEVSLDFNGKRIPGTPIYFDLSTSVAGMSRSDLLIETPSITQRIDFYPKLYFSVPLFQGLRLSPTLGLREIFYSDSIEWTDGSPTVVSNNVARNYMDLSIDLQGWKISKVWGNSDSSQWKHVLEPRLRYRMISGIDDYDEVILYDDVDAIADTSEYEFSLTNRFYIKSPSDSSSREWLKVKIAQKHFLDPDFNGALKENTVNQFFPLYTLTGLPYLTTQRDFSPITSSARFSPNSSLSVDVRSDFDPDRGRFRDFTASGRLALGLLSVSGSYYISEDILEDFGQNHQIQGGIGYGRYGQGFSANSHISYDAQDSRFLNYQVRASYFWDCCGVVGELFGYNLINRDERRQLRFSFYFKGLGSIGNIRRAPIPVF
ncbi:MAG: LPS assembly protein LptD [Acidobacteriota bacterium]